MKIRNIVFDLGGVLVDWDPRYLYTKIFSTEREVNFFLDNVCTYGWNLEQDRGRSLAEATAERVALFPEYRKEIEAYYGRWLEMFSGTFPDNVLLLNELTENPEFRVYALTNWSRETFPVAREKFPFFGHFEGVVISGVEKIIKPDPAIYRILFDRYRLDPAESVFIDDRQENVEGATQVGMHGIQFRPPMNLKEELEKLTGGSL